MNHAYDIALDPRNQQIVIAGEASAHFALARLTSTGQLDATFNSTGKLLDTTFDTTSAYLWTATVQNDGSILAGGADNGQPLQSFMLTSRYTSSGAIDTTFGQSGRIRTTAGLASFDIRAIAVDNPTGDIITAAKAQTSTGLFDFAVAKHLSSNQVKVRNAPVAPTGLKAVAVSATQVRLAWQLTNPSHADTITIEISTDGVNFTPVQTLDPAATATTIDGLDPLTDYTFRVRTENDVAVSPWSNTDDATTTDEHWEDVGDPITPDVSSEEPTWFANGDNLPAGRYRVLYTGGAVKLYDAPSAWTAFPYMFTNTTGRNTFHMPMEGTLPEDTEKPTPEEAQYLYEGWTSLPFDHHTNDLGFGAYLEDNDYTDNAGDGASFALQRLKFVDLDVDSDNTNGQGAPDQNAAEEEIEDKQDKPGKIIAVARHDSDGDGIPDFADGFDLTPDPADDSSTGSTFVPLIFTIDANLPENAKIRFKYAASDPLSGLEWVGDAEDGGYEVIDGSLRIWSVAGNQRGAQDLNYGGNFVSDDAAGFDISDVPSTLWVEAVRASGALADLRIEVEIDPDGSGFQPSDAVRLTAIDLNLEVSGLSERKEATVGGVAFENNDRDENNHDRFLNARNDNEPDFVAGADVHGIVEDDNELVQGTLRIDGPGLENWAQVKLSPHLKFWYYDEGKEKWLEARNNTWLPAVSGSDDLEVRIEGMSPTANLNDAWVDAYLSSVQSLLNPRAAIVTDSAKFSVISPKPVVHPLDSDFAPNHEGKIIIGTNDEMESARSQSTGIRRYYTFNPTTTTNQVAQTSDGKFVATVSFPGVDPALLAGKSIYFRAIDPDDQSPYDRNQDGSENTDGDDNLNPSPTFILDKATIQTHTINGTAVAAAETEVAIGSVSGNNFQIQASFDPDFENVAGESTTLVAWKRVYVELDRMHRSGATILSTFTPDANADPDILQVDNVQHLNAGQRITLFSKEGITVDTEVLASDAVAKTVTLPDLGTPFARYSGIKLPDDEGGYEVYSTGSLTALPVAFGYYPRGTDGGAFVEFATLTAGSGAVPRHAGFTDSDGLFEFSKHWFQNFGKRNTIQVGFFEAPGFQSPLRDDPNTTVTPAGIAKPSQRSAIILGSSPAQHTIAHEIGHLFGRLGAGELLPYVDSSLIQKLDHTGVAGNYDLMTYLGNGSEFSIDSLDEIRKANLGN